MRHTWGDCQGDGGRHPTLSSLGLAWCQTRLHSTRVDETDFQPERYSVAGRQAPGVSQ